MGSFQIQKFEDLITSILDIASYIISSCMRDEFCLENIEATPYCLLNVRVS